MSAFGWQLPSVLQYLILVSWLLAHSRRLFQGAAQGIPPLLVLAKQKKEDGAEGKT